jgi:hypothetical protein
VAVKVDKAWKWAALAVVALAALEIGVRVLWPGGVDPDRFPTLEERLAVVAAIALVALPHVIALLARRRRTWLLKVAGVVALTLWLVSTADATLRLFGIPVLLLPALAYFLVSARTDGRGRVPTLLLALVAALCAAGAAVSLFASANQTCYVEVDAGVPVTFTDDACYVGSAPLISGDPILGGEERIEWAPTTDRIVFHESLPSLGLSAAAVAFCLWGSRGTSGPEPAV